MERHRVETVGSGFGGLFAARSLPHADVDVTVVDRTNHPVFQPPPYRRATSISGVGVGGVRGGRSVRAERRRDRPPPPWRSDRHSGRRRRPPIRGVLADALIAFLGRGRSQRRDHGATDVRARCAGA